MKIIETGYYNENRDTVEWINFKYKLYLYIIHVSSITEF